MVDNAFRWAGEKKLLRINSVHGEEEAFLVLSETFELLDETGQTTEMNGTIEVEAGCSMCPSISSRTAAKRTPSKGGASGSGKPSSKGKRKGGKKEKEKKTKKEKKGKAPKDAAKGKLVGS
eukprot:s238_g7.t1